GCCGLHVAPCGSACPLDKIPLGLALKAAVGVADGDDGRGEPVRQKHTDPDTGSGTLLPRISLNPTQAKRHARHPGKEETERQAVAEPWASHGNRGELRSGR